LKKNIYSLARSLARYKEIIENKYPSIIKENEQRIIINRICKVSPDELSWLVDNWDEFYVNYVHEQEIDNIELNKDFDKYFKTLN
jgi:hypothetical protein